jgi:SAM-dependent methyltransferase
MALSEQAALADFYRRFAAHYDSIRRDGLNRIKRYLSSHSPTVRGVGFRALDLGCGTGHASLILSNAGWQVTGYDASEAMLTHARIRCPRSHFERADLRKVQLGAPAALAVCFGDTLNHLTGQHDWALLFKRLGQNLKRGGVFLFDVVTPFDHREVWPRSLEVAEGKEYVLVVRGTYDKLQCRAHLHHTWFARSESLGKYWHRFDDELQQVSFPADTIRQWLEKASFSDVSFLDGDTSGPPTSSSTRWFVRGIRR